MGESNGLPSCMGSLTDANRELVVERSRCRFDRWPTLPVGDLTSPAGEFHLLSAAEPLRDGRELLPLLLILSLMPGLTTLISPSLEL